MLLMLMRVLKSLNTKMFELIRALLLLSRISLIPYAEISMDSFTNAFIRPRQGSSGNPMLSGNSTNTVVRLFGKITQ